MHASLHACIRMDNCVLFYHKHSGKVIDKYDVANFIIFYYIYSIATDNNY